MSYRDFSDIVRDFYRCSLAMNFDDFDWDEAFEECRAPIRQKLAEHGLLGAEEYRRFYEDIYGEEQMEKAVEMFAIKTDWTWLPEDDILDIIFEGIAARLEQRYGSEFEDVMELHRQLEHRPELLLDHFKIQLFDACIHAQHCTGDIFEDYDVEAIREEIEREWREEQEEKKAKVAHESARHFILDRD